MSLNVRGIRDETKRRAIFNFYRSRCDIFCIQETHSCKEDETIWTSEWGGKIMFSHGSTSSRGTAILVGKNFQGKVTEINPGPDGRSITCLVTIHQQMIALCVLYAPNKDSPHFFYRENMFDSQHIPKYGCDRGFQYSSRC